MEALSNSVVLDLPKFKNENESFSKFRLANFKHYNLINLPTEFCNNWKYSNIGQLKLDRIIDTDLKSNYDFKSKYIDQYIKDSVFIDSNNGSVISTNIDGIKVNSLDSCFKNNQGLIDDFNFNFKVGLDSDLIDKLYFYNHAYCNNGTSIEVNANCQITSTLIIYTEANTNINTLNYLKLNDNSSIKIILVNFNRDIDTSLNLSNIVNKIKLGKNSKLYLAELNILNDKSFFVSKSLVDQDKDSSLEYLNFSFGSIQTKSDILINLNTGSNVSIYGSAYGNRDNNLSFNTIVNHLKPNAQSDIYYHIALNDAARSFYQGSIYVDETANGTQAMQKNKNLLFGKNCHAESLPRLEILANDVKCAHGATVGKIDLDQLFYLQSRGLSKINAEKLLVEGFLKQVFKRYSQSELFDMLRAFIDEELDKSIVG